ncbi:MAG: ABC transporter permease [Gemmataceae bacterium]|nr:ABC transporter permease [Gemmataceae bacterium]
MSGDDPGLYDPAGFVRPHDISHLPAIEKDGAAPVVSGQVSILFGAVTVPLGRDREEAIRFFQAVLANWVAGNLGILLSLIWTAGFLPTFLESSSVSVLLAKPPPRWVLLAGKYVGVLLFLLVQAIFFVCGTWLALGLRTSVWEPTYLLAIPMLLLHFTVFFSFSAFLAVWTRSTVTTVFGSILFWVICWAMNYGHHASLAYELEKSRDVQKQAQAMTVLAPSPVAGLPGSMPWWGLLLNTRPPVFEEQMSGISTLREIGYWLFPKPVDFGAISTSAVRTDSYFAELHEYQVLRNHQAFHPELAILSSLAFALVFLALAGYEFAHTDY